MDQCRLHFHRGCLYVPFICVHTDQTYYYVYACVATLVATYIIIVLCRYRLRPKMLRDVFTIDMKTTIMGDEINFPIGVASTAMHRMVHDEGELATARG